MISHLPARWQLQALQPGNWGHWQNPHWRHYGQTARLWTEFLRLTINKSSGTLPGHNERNSNKQYHWFYLLALLIRETIHVVVVIAYGNIIDWWINSWVKRWPMVTIIPQALRGVVGTVFYFDNMVFLRNILALYLSILWNWRSWISPTYIWSCLIFSATIWSLVYWFIRQLVQ